MSSKRFRILIVDGDPSRSAELRAALVEGGDQVEITRAASLEEAEAMEGEGFDATLFPEGPGNAPHPIVLDPLTGLAGRPGFESRLEQRLAQEKPFSLLFIDLDGFKKVNDTYGHQVGDRVLEEVAQRLKRSVRSQDLCCRWGGDEFTVLMRGDRRRKSLTSAAQRIVRSLCQPMAVDGLILRCGASTGLATYPIDGTDAHSLIQAADQAMYRAKFQGGSRLRAFDRQLELYEQPSYARVSPQP